MTKIIHLTEVSFSEVFGGPVTDRVAKKIREVDLQYSELSNKERDACMQRMTEEIARGAFEVVGSHRKQRWEEGWSKNLDAFKRGEKDALVPYYFRHDDIARWKRELVKPTKAGFDRGGLSIIMEWLFEKYMKDAPTVYEFGCGTGHHLLQLRQVNPRGRLFGLDFAEHSHRIVEKMVSDGLLRNAEARNFDFCNPDHSFTLRNDAVVYTVGALEQIGEKHGAFVDYLLEKRPALCVHIEPIAELLDSNHPLDRIAIEYFRQRGYLSGFLDGLRKRSAEGLLDLREVRRTFLGGNRYVDHYSVIVWSPR